jgi:hypothetical protein
MATEFHGDALLRGTQGTVAPLVLDTSQTMLEPVHVSRWTTSAFDSCHSCYLSLFYSLLILAQDWHSDEIAL